MASGYSTREDNSSGKSNNQASEFSSSYVLQIIYLYELIRHSYTDVFPRLFSAVLFVVETNGTMSRSSDKELVKSEAI